MTAAAIASVAAAAIGAAGSVGGAVISSQGAKAATRRGAPQNVPLPRYAQAINSILARSAALNTGGVPPSLAEYEASGGTATFPWQDPGITPVEAYKLGLVDRRGADIPGGPDSSLSDDERVFLAQWFARRGREGNPLYGVGKLANRIARVGDKPSTPKRDDRLDRLRNDLERRLARRSS